MLEEVKQHLKIDGAEDDISLLSLISDAKTEIKYATGVDVDESDDFQRITVIMLVKLSFGDFDSDPKAKETIERAIEKRLFKIRHCYPGEV